MQIRSALISIFIWLDDFSHFQLDRIDDFSHYLRMFIRRLGLNLSAGPFACASGHGCPDILELANGDFAIIGADITAAADQLPAGSGCGPNEKMVRIPRALLVRARMDIPAA